MCCLFHTVAALFADFILPFKVLFTFKKEVQRLLEAPLFEKFWEDTPEWQLSAIVSFGNISDM